MSQPRSSDDRGNSDIGRIGRQRKCIRSFPIVRESPDHSAPKQDEENHHVDPSEIWYQHHRRHPSARRRPLSHPGATNLIIFALFWVGFTPQLVRFNKLQSPLVA